MASVNLATCQAPVNIAVVKYWGKRDEQLILPINDSISLTLSTDDLCATTTIAASPTFKEDKLTLNGKMESTGVPRIQSCLQSIQDAARTSGKSPVDPSWRLHIFSKNNFPTAAGLASSAAGYACLVATLQNLYKLEGNFSSVARRGSGSACRSMFGGFVRWKKGEKADGSDSVAIQIAPASHWPEIRVIICVANDARKDTGSTNGMQRSVETSDLLKYRAEAIVPKRCDAMEIAILTRDFETFARLTMIDSNQLHAICQDTYPPVRYMSQISWDIVSLVHRYNELVGSNKLAYTFDAGPNAFLFCLEDDVPEVLQILKKTFPSSQPDFIKGIYTADTAKVTPRSEELTKRIDPHPADSLKSIITTKIGDGPRVITQHLCNNKGEAIP